MQKDSKEHTKIVKPGYYKILKQIFCCEDAEEDKAMTFKYDIDACGKREITPKMKKATRSSASATVTRPRHTIVTFRNTPNAWDVTCGDLKQDANGRKGLQNKEREKLAISEKVPRGTRRQTDHCFARVGERFMSTLLERRAVTPRDQRVHVRSRQAGLGAGCSDAGFQGLQKHLPPPQPGCSPRARVAGDGRPPPGPTPTLREGPLPAASTPSGARRFPPRPLTVHPALACGSRGERESGWAPSRWPSAPRPSPQGAMLCSRHPGNRAGSRRHARAASTHT